MNKYQKYNRTQKGAKRQKKYDLSLKGKDRHKRYAQSPKGKKARNKAIVVYQKRRYHNDDLYRMERLTRSKVWNNSDKLNVGGVF